VEQRVNITTVLRMTGKCLCAQYSNRISSILTNWIDELSSKLLNMTGYCLQKGMNRTTVKQMKKTWKYAIKSGENWKV